MVTNRRGKFVDIKFTFRAVEQGRVTFCAQMILKVTRMAWLKCCACEWTILNQCIMEVFAFFLVREILLAWFTLELDLVEYLVLKNLLLSFHILALADGALSAFNLINAFRAVDCLT